MAVQVTKEFHRLGRFLNDIVVKTVFGGVPLKKNMEMLKGGCDILIGTPGRIADLVRHNAISVKDLRYFVVDECDLQIGTIRRRGGGLFPREPQGHPGGVPEDAHRQAGDDVHGDAACGREDGVSQVHAERGSPHLLTRSRSASRSTTRS
jgi:ATP-dependent RNA helicase DDX39